MINGIAADNITITIITINNASIKSPHLLFLQQLRQRLFAGSAHTFYSISYIPRLKRTHQKINLSRNFLAHSYHADSRKPLGIDEAIQPCGEHHEGGSPQIDLQIRICIDIRCIAGTKEI